MLRWLSLNPDFGHSYASDSLDAATEYYKGEIECANSAAKLSRQLGATGEWVLSVGATPTTHAATSGETKQEGLEGALELYVALLFSPCLYLSCSGSCSRGHLPQCPRDRNIPPFDAPWPWLTEQTRGLLLYV